ncbi:MAG TPA: hypothetical protein VGF70_10215 [Solirubrobacteraceae bacterium]|jgi:uncharacterized membrane protein
MSSKAIRSVGKTALKRVSGSKVGLFRAQIAAAIVGTGTAVATYRVLRSDS